MNKMHRFFVINDKTNGLREIEIMLQVVECTTNEETPMDKPKDIFLCVNHVEKWRLANDVIYRLLITPEDTELFDILAGLINPDDSKIGLLYQKYTGFRTATNEKVLNGVLFSREDVRLDDTYRRTSAHFILFAALALESEFVTYISKHTYDRNKLRYFVSNVLPGLLTRLLRGMVLSKGDNCDEVTGFVRAARNLYMIHCTPHPPNIHGPASPLDCE